MNWKTFLTKERYSEYQKVNRQNVLYGVFSLMLAFILDNVFGSLDWINVFCYAIVILFLIRLFQGKTFFQFQQKEVSYSKQQSQKALKKLHVAAKKRKK